MARIVSLDDVRWVAKPPRAGALQACGCPVAALGHVRDRVFYFRDARGARRRLTKRQMDHPGELFSLFRGDVRWPDRYFRGARNESAKFCNLRDFLLAACRAEGRRFGWRWRHAA